jgi:lipid-binding SYLF domain-containing protein
VLLPYSFLRCCLLFRHPARATNADLVSFTRAKGIYGELNLDGTVLNTNIDWNDAYYGGQNVLPPDILPSTRLNKYGYV